MTPPPEEFARRFLQDVLPGGLVRVRHSGLLAKRSAGAWEADTREDRQDRDNG